MISNLILSIAIMIIVGFFGGAAAHRFKFPRVTGYILIGIILSPSLTGVIQETTVNSLELITSISLGIIAYSIGGRLRLSTIKSMGKTLAWITPLQAVGTWFLTALIITFVAPFIVEISNPGYLHAYFPVAFVLGAIASATAPATIIAVIREYRAKGSLTTALLSIVAIDDGLAIIIFSIAIGVSGALAGMAEGFAFSEMLLPPLIEIAGSVGIGAVLGLAVIGLSRFVSSRSLVMVVVIGLILLCVGIAEILELSLILANMVMGFIICNLSHKKEVFTVVDDIEDIVFALFFVLAGLHFELNAMSEAGLLALVVFAARFGGKYFGAMAGAHLADSPKPVKNYLGIALLPAAGVSIGLALLAKKHLPEFGSLIYNTVLAAVILNAIAGPLLTKLAISRAGERNQG